MQGSFLRKLYAIDIAIQLHLNILFTETQERLSILAAPPSTVMMYSKDQHGVMFLVRSQARPLWLSISLRQLTIRRYIERSADRRCGGVGALSFFGLLIPHRIFHVCGRILPIPSDQFSNMEVTKKSGKQQEGTLVSALGDDLTENSKLVSLQKRH